VPRLCELYNGICLTTEEKAQKILRVVEKCQFGMIHCVRMATLQVAREVVDPDFCALGDLGQHSGQHRCLPSCSTKGFPTSANFESNHSEI
jgi:hypothetical protein